MVTYDYVRRGNTILTAADYVACGNSSGKVTYLDVLRARIEASRVHIEELRTTTTVSGTKEYHAAVSVRAGVLVIRKSSCNGTCCFREGHYVLGCQCWKAYVLFVQPDAVPDTPPNQQELAPREDVEAAGVNSKFQVGAYLAADFDGMYFFSEVVRQETDGAVWMKYLRTVRGKLNKYNWLAIEGHCRR